MKIEDLLPYIERKVQIDISKHSENLIEGLLLLTRGKLKINRSIFSEKWSQVVQEIQVKRCEIL